MHIIDINNKKINLEASNLETLLSVDMGFFADLKKQKIKFNAKPFTNNKNVINKTINQKSKGKIIDLHLNLIKKIDDLIEENKELTKIVHDPLYISARKINSPLSNIVEIRQPTFKKIEMPLSRSEIEPGNFNTNTRQREEFFEIEFPKVTQNEKENNEEPLSWMLNEKDVKKTTKNESKIKIRYKNQEAKMQSKDDNYEIKTKLELEKTKKEIEEKKLALEKALREEKQKENELKRVQELKQKEEKLKRLEIKKKQKEEKIKQRELLKLQKEKEKQLKIQEEIKSLEKRKDEEKKKLEEELEKKKEESKEIKEEIKDTIDQETFKNIEEENTDLLKNEHEINIEENINLSNKEPESVETEVITDDKKINISETEILDQDVAKLLPIIDNLFNSLPEDILEKFAQSEYFELYEKVMLKYRSK